MDTAVFPSEADILSLVISPEEGGLIPEAAHALLDFQFNKDSTKQIRRLLQKNNQGRITAAEHIALERFLRVGKFLDLLHAKARLSLKEAGHSK